LRKNFWLNSKLAEWGVYAARHRGWVLGLTLLLTILCVPPAYHAVSNLDANLFNQVSNSLVRFRTFRELNEDFSGDILAGVLTTKDTSPECIKEMKDFASRLSGELAQVGLSPADRALLGGKLAAQIPPDQPWLAQVECRVGQGLEKALKSIAEKKFYALMTPADVAELKKLFEPQALDQALDRAAEILKNTDPLSAERQRLQQDPLSIAGLARRAFEERVAQKHAKLAGSGGYFLSPDQTTLVVLGRALRPATELDFNTALMTAVQRAENRALKSFRETKPVLTTALKGRTFGELARGEHEGSLRVAFTGMPAITIENQMSLKHDLIINTATSFFGVLLIFLIMFRSWRLAWNFTWTTVCVIIWTLALAGLTRGGISVLGGAFTCILVGIGSDYLTYLYNAFYEFRHVEKLPEEEALRRTMFRSGLTILTAMATTALAFYGVCFTRFAGIAEFGFLAGATLLLYALATLLIFPALLARSDGTPGNMPAPNSLGMAGWGRILERRGVKTAVACISALLLAAALTLIFLTDPGPERLAGVRFDPELSNLRSTQARALNLRDRLALKFGLGLADLRIVVDAPEEQHAFAGMEELAARMEPFVKRNELAYGGSILDFIPSPRQQEASIAALKSFDFDGARNSFEAAAQKRFGKKGLAFFSPFLELLNRLRDQMREARPLTLAELMRGPLAGILGTCVRLDFSGENVSRVRLASSWYPAKLNYPAAWHLAVAQALEKDPPPGVVIRATSARMIGLELKDAVLHDFIWITLVVACAVAACMLAALGSLRQFLLALIPMVFGYAALLAGVAFSQRMGWNLSLNFVNLLLFPLLLGSGVDGGIYMVFDAFASPRPTEARLMADTGRAVMCCILTTLVGFGSMLLSNYTGLISLGAAALFGYCGALFGAVIVLPAVLPRKAR
jgi:predicted RND superfamily exporter protein